MQLIRIPAVSLGPDPSTPQDVPVTAVFDIPRTLPDRNRPVRLFVGAAGGGPITVTFYALEEGAPGPGAAASVKFTDADTFVQIGDAGISAAVGVLTTVTELGGATPLTPPPGKTYARVTAGNAADRVLLIGFA